MPDSTPAATRGPTLRVTHVACDLEGGGLQTFIATLVRRYAGTEIESSVISLDGKVGQTGAGIVSLTRAFVTLRPWPVVSMVAPLGLAAALRRLQPDVVHIHSGVWHKSALAARLAGVPRVLFTEHGREHHDPALQRRVDRLAAGRTDVVVAVSHRLTRYLRDVVGVPAARLVTVENGVDREVYFPGEPPAELRQQLQLPANALILGSVGRLEAVKRYDRLLHLMTRLPAQDPEGRPIFLLLCGDGGERAALEQLSRELGIANRIRFAGWSRDPAGYYRLLDVFALTSQSEGLSLSLLEALASGCVPAVNDVGANAEVLGPDLAGQVAPDGDWDRFEQVARRTLADAPERERLRAIGVKRTADHYDIRRTLDAYRRLYHNTPGPGV